MRFNSIKVNNTDTNYTHSIFDISEYTGKTYDTLSDALTDVPDGKQKGGMTVSFVSTSDNKYVQCMYLSTSTAVAVFTNTDNWEKINLEENLEEIKEEVKYKADCIFDDSDADLNIGDNNGEIILQLNGGDIKTKNFDSRNVANNEFDSSDADLNIGDDNGEVIVQFKDGHIKTKNFDSRDTNNGIINVKSYGAIGDDNNDDTQAIQTVLNMCGTIIIPSGTYKITQPLVFRSNTHIIMSPDAELKQFTPSTRCVYYGKNDTEYNGVHDVIIEGGILNANDVTSQQSCSCLAMIHCKNITLKNLTFKGVGVGMHCVDMAASKDVVFDKCVFRDNGTVRSWGCCLQIDGANSNTSYPYLSLIGVSNDDPIYDDCGCMNIEIKSCQFYLNEYSPAIGNHNYSKHEYIDIHDNIIYGSGVSIVTHDRGAIAFDMYSGYAGKVNLTDKVFIHHNFITDCPYGFSLDPNSIESIYIRDNYFVNIGSILKVQADCAKLLNNIQ